MCAQHHLWGYPLKAQVFYFEICEILMNIYFEEHLQTTASDRLETSNHLTGFHVMKHWS